MPGRTLTGGAVLIVTRSDDAHVPYVTRHLRSPYVLLDPSLMIEGIELSYLHDGTNTVPFFNGRALDDIKSVWYRRPYMPEAKELRVPEGYGKYAASSLTKQARDLNAVLPDAYWLTDYFSLIRAEVKPRQLALAAQAGFRTPLTLATNSQPSAKEFIGQLPAAIAKSMADTLPLVDGKVQYFYTTRIKNNSAGLKGLHLAPAIFQAAIDTVRALRITVVGKQVFAAALDEGNVSDEPDISDWRRGYTAGGRHFSACRLPGDVKNACLRLTRSMNLDFGAIDVLVDTAGEHWFLEINPNGQWAFIEDDTGLPIGKAIAGLLDKGR